MRTNKKAVAIFDDDEDILSICSYILEEKGWTVHTFTDCTSIKEKVTGCDPAVILMDNWIPDDGGIIATRVLMEDEAFRHIPVIFFSANSEIESLAAKAGTEFFLAKPFDLDQLENIIKETLSRKP